MTTISNNDIARAIYLSLKDTNLEVLPPSGGRTSKYAKIVQFLVRKRLLGKSADVLLRLQKVVDKEAGTIRAIVKTANNLSVKTKRELEQVLIKRYSTKGAVVSEQIDKKLLGGFRVEVNDEVIDLTFRNKIARLEEYLTRSA